MTNKKNKNKHSNHRSHQQNTPKVEVSEEELLKQCLSLHQLLKDRTTKLRQLETGEMCYVISTRWLRDWKEFVGYDATVKEDQKVDKRYYGKRHPGKINSDLEPTTSQLREFYSLPKEMKDYEYLNQIIGEKKGKDDDFIAITQQIWLALLEYYEGEPILRPVRKTKGSIFYDGELLRCETIFVNLQNQELENDIKKTSKRFYDTIFPGNKIQLSTLWNIDDLTLFFKQYCLYTYGHDNIRIWKGHSYLGTLTIATGLIQAIKEKRYQVRGRLLNAERYKDIDIDEYLKSTYTLIVEIGEALKEEAGNGELKGYCEECVEKKPLVVSCVCHEVDYCHDRCRIDDQTFHFKTCPHAFDSEDDEEFQLKYTNETPKAGLDNLGNTCYMNSVLQSLFSLDHFRQLFSSNEYLKHLNEKEAKDNNCLMLRKFSKTIKYLLEEEKSYTPWPLKGQIGYFMGPFRGYQQHDANDFLINFINCLNDFLSKQGEKAYHHAIQAFIGQFHSKVICPHCNIKSENNEIFMQVSLPIKSKAKQLSYNYLVVNGVGQSIRGKASLGQTWTEMKKAVNVPGNTPVFMAKEPDGLVLIDEEERSPEKILKALKGSQLVYYKDLAIVEGETLFVAGLVTTKDISGFKMKSPYGHANILTINDVEVTLGTLWLKVIQTFFLHKPEVVAEAAKMEQEYFSQITQAIQAECTQASSKMAETKEGEQEEESQACRKIVQHFNEAVKKFKQKIGIDVFIHHFRKSRNICAFCKKKCQNCELPIIFDKAFEDFFAERYKEVRFQVHLKEPVEISTQTIDLAASGEPTIHDCLELFNQPEQLDEENAWYCQNCDNMGLALKELEVTSFPPVLVLHLNRFKTVEQKKVKNSEPIQYADNEIFGGRKYKLTSVVIHEGSMEAGHYWSISLRGDQYYVFNDAKVTPIEKTFNKNAYILIYCALDYNP